MRLPNRYPSESDVKEQLWRPTLNIIQHVFTEAKEKLSQYLKFNNKHFIVRDHCHWTGEFRGAAHQQCNLMYRKTFKISFYLLNFTGYESHNVVQNISSLENPPKVIAKSMEKFISMEIDGLVIKDSLKFLNCSWDKLGSHLKERGLKENKVTEGYIPYCLYLFQKEMESSR